MSSLFLRLHPEYLGVRVGGWGPQLKGDVVKGDTKRHL